MTKAVTINLDAARAAELERIALDNGVTLEELVSEVVDFYALDQPDLPPLTEEEQAKIDRAIAQADAGQVVSQDDVEAWLKRRFGK